MSSHTVTIVVYTVIALIGLGLELLSHGTRSRMPSLGRVLSRVMHTRSGRVGIVVGWIWLGLHFLAR